MFQCGHVEFKGLWKGQVGMSSRKGETYVLRRQAWAGDGDQISLEMVVEALAIDEHARDSVGRSENKPIKGWSQGESTQNHVSVDKERVSSMGVQQCWALSWMVWCTPWPHFSNKLLFYQLLWIPPKDDLLLSALFEDSLTWRTLPGPGSHLLPGVAHIHWPTQWDKGLASLSHLGQLCRATVVPNFPVELAETQVGVHCSSASPSAPSSFLPLPSVGTEPKCAPK